jgi:hypothetical protein
VYPREAPRKRARSTHALLAALCGVLIACGSRSDGSGAIPSPDLALFEASVYPVLLRDCAFSECHGAEQRFFQVYGPGRLRLDPTTTKPGDPATPMEIERSYERARSMLLSGESVTQSLLLRKPLELSQGGQAHKGVDVYGRNVFESNRDPGYLALEKWATAGGATP